MDAELKTKWLAALRSGDYQQACGVFSDDHDSVQRFCCLAVACHAAGREVRPVVLARPDEHYRFMRGHLGSKTVDDLIGLNDQEGLDFAKIADYIEVNL